MRSLSRIVADPFSVESIKYDWIEKSVFLQNSFIINASSLRGPKQKEMKEYLVLGNSNEVFRIATEDILYVLASGNCSVFHFTYGDTIRILLPIGKVEENLINLCPQTSKNFVRMGRSLIINRSYLFYINFSDKKLVLLDRNKERKEVKASGASLNELADFIGSSAI
jgi:DNA-binding LytR/AlgR family response regulator